MAVALASPILRLDLNLKQATGAVITLTVVDAAGQTITDFTGYTSRAQIRRTATGPVLFEWNTNPTPAQGGITLTYNPGPPAQSTATLTVTWDQSALWTWRLAQWDCMLINPLGQISCLAAGVVRVEPAMTR